MLNSYIICTFEDLIIILTETFTASHSNDKITLSVKILHVLHYRDQYQVDLHWFSARQKPRHILQFGDTGGKIPRKLDTANMNYKDCQQVNTVSGLSHEARAKDRRTWELCFCVTVGRSKWMKRRKYECSW